ncbi:MAG: penicillin-binding protein 1C [bacterium]|nr:penicillin-binding protein 1C [bacterium]
MYVQSDDRQLRIFRRADGHSVGKTMLAALTSVRSFARRRHRWFLWGAGILLILATLHWMIFPLPKENLSRPYGSFVYSRDNRLLNCFTASDRFWRKPVKLEEISPQLIDAVIATEDKWFRFHPGCNPISLLSAAYDNVTAGKFVRGGSTITMQIARMIEPKERTVFNKFIEIFRALQLELTYSKDELLEFYFNLAPYGGNIEGVGAASYLYFGKRPSELTLSEIAILTAIPASPNQFRPDANLENCRRRRDTVINRLLTDSVIDSVDAAQAKREEIPDTRVQPAVAAPHFCQLIARRYPERTELASTIDFKLQVVCEQLATGFQQSLREKAINNLSLVVLDSRTSELLAMVGSANFGDVAHQGQVNGAISPRSPGSALKPFVYGLAFDKGLISPGLRLEDLPVNYSGYMPVNYDGEYHGIVRADDALIQSLNVPAVNLASRVGVAQIYNLMKRGGISTLTRKHQEYGLPLVLGSCEVTLLELTNMYAMLARGGQYESVALLADHKSGPGERLLTSETTYLLAEILSELKRPDLPSSWEFTTDMPRVAWKTGTSYGRKDAWAIGYNPDFTIGVWAGNFTAEGSIAIVGAEIAAPLMLSIFDHLYTKRQAPWYARPDNVKVRSICATSGMTTTAACPSSVDESYIAGLSPTRQCDLHKKVLVDNRSGYRLCPHCSDGKKYTEKVIEQYSPKIATWLLRRGVISLLPQHDPSCTGASGGEDPVITSPEHGAVYMVQDNAPLEYQKILFEASVGSDAAEIHWFLDGELFATATDPDSRIFYTPKKGDHRLMCVDTQGRSASISFRVE